MTRALTFILSATLAAACVAQDQNQVEYAVNVPNPELVEIRPNLEVVANARDPVFRVNDAFWLYRDGRWYRNDELKGRWVRIVTPPHVLASLDEPRQYANYSPVTRTVEQRDLRTQREPIPRSQPLPRPQAPYPRPPHQEPPVLDDPGTVDRVPRPPTMPEPGTGPSQPNPTPPGEAARPDPMHD